VRLTRDRVAGGTADIPLCVATFAEMATAHRNLERDLQDAINQARPTCCRIPHRVKTISGGYVTLLNLQEKQIAPESPRRCANNARRRLSGRSLALVQSLLYESAELGSATRRLPARARDSAELAYGVPKNRSCQVAGRPNLGLAESPHSFALLMTEAMTNRCATAFPTGAPAAIDVRLKQLQERRVALRVHDRRHGLPPANWAPARCA